MISDTKLPEGLPDDAWEPENDGLRAAALMPDRITRGTAAKVRIFIRNTSERNIHPTVSDRPGYG